jgi:hypothetical protein
VDPDGDTMGSYTMTDLTHPLVLTGREDAVGAWSRKIFCAILYREQCHSDILQSSYEVIMVFSRNIFFLKKARDAVST